MVKLISISLLFCTLVAIGKCQEKPKFTLDVSLPGGGSIAMANSSHFFTVLYSSIPNGAYNIEKLQVSVNSTNGRSLSTCSLSIRFDPDRNQVARDITQLMKGAVLGNGRQIVTWIYHENQGNYELRPLLIDVQDCTYKSLSLPYTPDRTFRFRLPFIIPYANSFDLFFLTDIVKQKCWPCRYNNEGELIELQNEVQGIGSLVSLLFESLNVPDTREKYFYVQNHFDFPKETAILQILDDNFTVVREAVIDRNIDTISTDFNDGILKIGLCKSFPKFYHAISCEQFNSNLSSIFYNRMQLFQNQSLDIISLKLDAHGNSHVISTSNEGLDVPRKYHYIRLDASGKLVKTLNLGELEVKIFAVELKSLIIGDQFCFISTEMDLNGIGRRKIVRCIPI